MAPRRGTAIDHDPRILGVVLAGGRSSRFGRDKAVEPLPGPTPTTLTQHALELLAPLVDGLVLVRAAPGVLVAPGVQVVADPEPGQGPLQALVAAMQAAPADVWLVAPCDAPRLTAKLYRRLLAEVGPAPGAFFVRARGAEPLVSLFRPSGRRLLETALAEHASIALKDLLLNQGFQPVRVRPEEEPCFRNINTPADWREFTSRRTGSPGEVLS